jgi:dTDP-4-dehydrorhamnose reductase
MNHYVTSERFLDADLAKYPTMYHGGNGREAYADLPAVRVRAEGLLGPVALLRELWQRYRRPVAITEVQLACTREEQVRWLAEAWESALQARQAGVPVRAITSWALFGAYDWDTLLQAPRDHYENGAFAVRDGVPHETALAAAIHGFATQGAFQHPVLAIPGWWRRPGRLEYAPVIAPRGGPGTALAATLPWGDEIPPLLVVAARSEMIQDVCAQRGLPYRAILPEDSEAEPTPAGKAPAWGVLLDHTAPTALSDRCQALGIPWVVLPEVFDRWILRRALDRLIDAALLQPTPVSR